MFVKWNAKNTTSLQNMYEERLWQICLAVRSQLRQSITRSYKYRLVSDKPAHVEIHTGSFEKLRISVTSEHYSGLPYIRKRIRHKTYILLQYG